MKVIDSKILIKVKKEGATEKFGGFEVPIGAGEFEVGEVISVGEKVTGVSPGDTIYFYMGSGKEFTHESIKYRVITIPEVIVVL
jgi:co-chaperonin GroES (HSP10)